jgi:tight adherence protein B
MSHVVFAVLVGIAVYVALVAFIPSYLLKGSTPYTRAMLKKLEHLKIFNQMDLYSTNVSILREQGQTLSIMARIFMALPGANAVYPHLLKAGMGNHIDRFFSICLGVFGVAFYALKGMGWIGAIFMAAIITFLFGGRYLQRQINKRNEAFLQYFPDALDMVVRSVRSGYPISSAIRMVADNMQPPVSAEFKQVADEVAYGSTLIDALQRLASRIDEPDVHFFVVVLSVQQDIGGSLAEVLNNLSSIIRKRKHLRIKIKSLSSEGRATAWVLGSMPFAEAAIIQFTSPDYLEPLFTTSTGNMFLALTLGMIAIGVFVIKQIVSIRV